MIQSMGQEAMEVSIDVLSDRPGSDVWYKRLIRLQCIGMLQDGIIMVQIV